MFDGDYLLVSEDGANLTARVTPIAFSISGKTWVNNHAHVLKFDEYVQIYVISNGTNTKYYSNSTRYNAIKDAEAANTKKGKTSNSFEFTSFWADANNRIIPDLIDFTKTFFAKHTILNILTKYCVFTSENMLMVMRPYQITATERILNRIEIAHNYKKYGDIAAGGYVWHTTGSGKTLTSFKTARLASNLSFIDKVLFVVDRKDLDYQTMKEYDRFEKGAANSNSSTAILEKQLRDTKSKIIITTIQKLSTFIEKNAKDHPAFNKQVVINIDYILMLVKKYHDTHCEDKEVLITIRKAIDASPELRSKKELIEAFLNGVNDVDDVMVEWHDYVVEMREQELVIIIEEERLKEDETRKFLENAFREGEVKTVGTDIDKIMPPVSRFGGGNRANKKKTVIDRLKAYFDKSYGVGGVAKFTKDSDEN